jgi:hypothetical protein
MSYQKFCSSSFYFLSKMFVGVKLAFFCSPAAPAGVAALVTAAPTPAAPIAGFPEAASPLLWILMLLL